MDVKSNQRYTIKYFYESMPDWKRKKDPILTKLFYRPVSYVFAAMAANMGISANAVSYMGAIVAVFAAAAYIINSHSFHIIGAVLANVWLLMDCIDGNLARGIKKQPFGEFADAMGSYLMVGLICTAMSFSVYCEGGIFISSGAHWIILLGAFASSSDSLMRLIYQKYKNIERKWIDNGTITAEYDVRNDVSKVRSFKIVVENEFGIGGILPFAILIATIFHALDLVVIYCFCYYGLAFIVSVLMYTHKAIKNQK